MNTPPASRLPPPAFLQITNPADGSIVAKVATDTAVTIAAKYAAARAAQPAWQQTAIAQRIDIAIRFREQIVARCEELAKILTSEVGKPIAQSRNELEGVLERIDFFVSHAAKVGREEIVFADRKLEEVITYEPLGVVANVSAWNYPYFVGANVFVPALLMGNAVLYKPSEYATLTGLEIANTWHFAGVPKDVFAAVIGGGDVGAALVEQPVDAVFFTGSFEVGQKIAAAAGPRLAKIQLELGGKDPIYVCDDVEIESAAASLADGAFYNTGQSCCSVERIYVAEKIYDAFIEKFVDVVRDFKIGDPADESTYIGPLTRRAQLAVLKAQVADATSKGARLVLGGKPLAGKGNYFEPTVFADVDHRMDLMREESFGPIIGVQKVRDDTEAVSLMNDTRYGLTAGIYTKDRKRAEAVLAHVRSGSVYWNCCDRVSPRLPWSGVGHSGIGLTLSTYGMQTFLRPKAWHMRGP